MDPTVKEGFGRRRRRLGDILVDAGVITEEQLLQALEYQSQQPKKIRLGLALVQKGITTEVKIMEALKEQLHIESVTLTGYEISSDIIKMVAEPSMLKKHAMIPYSINPEYPNRLYVAMADPLDIVAMDDLGVVTGMDIVPAIATNTEIMSAIDRYYGGAETRAMADRFAQQRGDKDDDAKTEEMQAEVESSPIVVLVKTIIEQAVRMRASDIHIEPLETIIRVRYRIDGVLQEINRYQVSLLSAIIARIKIIGGMDISEKRKPQDGRITQIVDHMEYDIRASILPTVFGEKVVMRLTSKQTLTREKSNLGFSPEEMRKFDRILSNPNGIILVTGPTGSGKSTTLYTALSELNTTDVNIITVEDPVEANIDGINQVQVNVKADLTFASALRSILRQDPDIIMIGEIRDEETANIAVTASITGHLVVSTLHTNSAASSLTRLADMGIATYLLADSVVGVIAQRLVRRLCSCKEAYEPTPEEWMVLGDRMPGSQIFKPCGCPKCNDSGYRGRIGVYEILPVTNKVKRLISRGASAEEIQDQALSEGMSTLRMSATRLVQEGVTSVEELMRIAYSNEDDMD
ncbi:MAG: Flp pilus assembly complex ATPase component TadA [Lachnospiraceae bacterium]|nr:Flp pilus assembly complex ATPase component TadA [Lachnospiraceae bacterium]